MEFILWVSYLLGVVDAFVCCKGVKSYLVTRSKRPRGEERFFRKRTHGSLAGLYALLVIFSLIAGRPAFIGFAIGLIIWLILFALARVDWKALAEYFRDNNDDDDPGSGSDYHNYTLFM